MVLLAYMRQDCAFEAEMSILHVTRTKQLDGRAPAVVSVLAIGGLSVLSWGFLISVAMAVSAAL